MRARGTVSREAGFLLTSLCCLPARQGSQIGSDGAREFRVRPETKFLDASFCTSPKLRWPKRRCHKVMSIGHVLARPTCCVTGSVTPSKCAVFDPVTVAVKIKASSLSKNSLSLIIVTDTFLFLVRCRTDRRLLRSW